MLLKVLALVVIVSIAEAGHLAGGLGGYGGYDGYDGSYNRDSHQIDYYAHPKYEYKYNIEDPHTGDYKSQHEQRDGDVVKGEYSLLDSDGTFRKVQYTADKHSGFNAIVTKDGHLIHPQPQQHHY